MQLPTDPQSVAHLDRLMAEVEEAKTRWLDAVERLRMWIESLEDGRRSQADDTPSIGLSSGNHGHDI